MLKQIAWKAKKRRPLIAFDWLARPATRLAAAVAVIVLVFLLGGGSRADIRSLILLRPLVVILVAYALTQISLGELTLVKWPLAMLGALAAWMTIQLVPLPPAFWQALPGRQIVANIELAAGMEAGWRPMTLSPSKTLNSLMSLLVPLAMLLLYAIQTEVQRRRLWFVFAAMIGLSGLLGLMQIAGPDGSPLYFYRITNDGSPVGFFANRNHQAIMLAIILPVVALLVVDSTKRGGQIDRGTLGIGVILAAAIIVMPLLLLTGSRAGLLAGAVASFAVIAIFQYGSFNKAKAGSLAGRSEWQRLLPVAVGIVLVLVAGLAVYFDRAIALDRLLGDDPQGGLRLKVLPTLSDMITHYMPVGSGFGTFQHVYKAFEPNDLLSPFYLNQAHNDWAQFLIEGGFPALSLLGAFLGWLGMRIRSIINHVRTGHSMPLQAFTALSIIAIMGGASLADYPLRVPSVMALAAFACAVLADKSSTLSGLRRSGGSRHEPDTAPSRAAA